MMSEQTNAIQISNYEKIRSMARNKATIEKFAMALGSRANATSYISSAMLAVANSDDLMECAPATVFNAVLRSAALRLSCDPALRQAHLVPFYNGKKKRREAQFIPGYIGLQQLAQRTGKYRFLNPGELFEGQVLDVDQLTGKPAIRGQRTGNTILGYFHYFQLFSGYESIFFMDIASLHAHGERYAPKNPMWKSHFPDMCKKTVTRLHLLKDGILDPFDRSIIQASSEEMEDGEIIGDTLDGTFTDADVEAAAQEAAQQKADAPKRTEKQNLSDLGYDTETGEIQSAAPSADTHSDTPVEAEAPQDVSTAPMVKDEAQTQSGLQNGDNRRDEFRPWMMTEGDKPIAYDELTSEELAGRATSIGNRKPKSEEDKKRIAYIMTILQKRNGGHHA